MILIVPPLFCYICNEWGIGCKIPFSNPKWGRMIHKVITYYSGKLKLFFVVITLLFIAIISRLYSIQILQGEYYTQKAENNFLDTIRIPAKRGNIYDRHGTLLARNLAAFNLYLIPKFLDQDTAKFIISKLHLSDKQRDRIKEALGKKSSHSLLIKERLTEKELSILETRKYRLRGLDIVTQPYRYYPYHGITAHIVGYINKITPKEYLKRKDKGYHNSDWMGRIGVERYLESALRGKDGKQVVIRDKNGLIKKDNELQKLVDLKNNEMPPLKEGYDLYLTLDLKLQESIHELFTNIKSGAAIVLDTETGDVLASYSKPTFNPNLILASDTNYLKSVFTDELQPTYNKVHKLFFPGSVFKLVSAIAILDAGIANEEDTVDCKGFELYGSTIFRCWNKHGHGSTNIKKAIMQSCDVYFYRMAKKLGLDRLQEYSKKLGFNTTFTDFMQGIPRGFVPNRAWYLKKFGRYQKGTALNSVIGQGDIYLSPFKVAEMYMITANLGIRKRINIVDRILSKQGDIKYRRKVVQKTIDIPPDVFQKVNKGLFAVVNNPRGTAYYHRLKHPLVAGKTGTAQVASKTKDEYEFEIPWRNRHHAWFAGIAPAYKPEIVVVVLIEHGGSSGVAVPIAMDIIKAYERLKTDRMQAHFSLKNLLKKEQRLHTTPYE